MTLKVKITAWNKITHMFGPYDYSINIKLDT